MAQFRSLQDMKKQASFYLRERFNDARLALTDVSRFQLLAEEATNVDSWGPERKTMAILADAAFELEEYERIAQVMHNRLDGSKQRPWRQLHKTLILLEYLLLHGPISIGKEFSRDILQLEESLETGFRDEQGGSMVYKALERVVELLNNPDLWKEERLRARKLPLEMVGFGCSLDHTRRNNNNPNTDEICKVLSYKPSSVVNHAQQSKQGGYANGRKVLSPSFKKSLSSLSSFKESFPYLGWQTLHDKDGTSAEEVSICLLNEREGEEGLFGQVAQKIKATEGPCQLVIENESNAEQEI